MFNKKLKFACFIHVRTHSSRLPGKPLKLINGKRAVEHLIERIKLAKRADLIVMCTTDQPQDDVLEMIAKRHKIECFRGSADDVLVRWLGAVEKFGIDYFVQIDGGDDLFTDPEIVDMFIKQMKKVPVDFMKAPDGFVCGGSPGGCISAVALKKVCEIKNTEDTHDWIPYFTKTKYFKVKELVIKDKIFFNDNVRLTMDYLDDLRFFRSVFKDLNIQKNSLPLRSILKRLSIKPELAKINLFRQQDYLVNREKFIGPQVK
ncbi:MAG: hypothetical protein AAB784_03395 [Patescibacteria group bacterium]